MYLVYGYSSGLDYINIYIRDSQKAFRDWSRYDFINFFRDNFIMNDVQLCLLSKCSVRDMRNAFLIWTGSGYSFRKYLFDESAYYILSSVYRFRYFRKLGCMYED